MVFEAASKFLSRFNYQNITYQIFKEGKPINVFYQAPNEIYLAKTNEEVFFMVNQGDGIAHHPNKTCRSQKSVTTLKACFIDVDNVPINQVIEFLKKTKLAPHSIVNTSPNKFHIYFLIKDLEVNPKTIYAWKLVQETLSKLGTDKILTDPTMTDYSRVLRVPGFAHLKDPNNPFVVKELYEGTHDKYKLVELVNKLDIDLEQPKESKKYQASTNLKVEPGNRHQDLTSLGGHLFAHGLPRTTVKELLFDRIRARFDNPDAFLPGGNRAAEVDKFLDYAFKEHQKEHISKIPEVESTKAQKVDPFSLPDSFFFDCPSIAGEITQTICSTAYISNAPFTFATIAACIGMLKGNSTSELGHSPSNYFLCLGPTGSGKNYPQEVITQTLAQLSLSSFCDLRMRSEKGVLSLLQDHPSSLIMTDEAEFFLSSLNDRFAPPYIKACKPLLLELYTAGNKIFNYGRTGEESQIEIVKPRLNYVGFGVLSALENSFNVQSISDGLLQRFIIVSDFRSIDINKQFEPATSLNGNAFDYLADLRSRLTKATEDDLNALAELEIELQQARQERKQTKIKEVKAKIRLLKAIVRQSDANRIHTSKLAKDALSAYSATLVKRRNRDQDSALCGLWTRGAEQAGRLATALCTEQGIDIELMDWCIEFIESRLQSVHSLCSETMDKTGLEKQAHFYLRKIAEISKMNSGEPVTKRQLSRSVSVKRRADYVETIKYLAECNYIEILSQYRSGTRGRSGEAYLLADVL